MADCETDDQGDERAAIHPLGRDCARLSPALTGRDQESGRPTRSSAERADERARRATDLSSIFSAFNYYKNLFVNSTEWVR